MNAILVLQNKALNATGVTSLNNLNNLEQGALAIVLDAHTLYTGAEPLADVERIQFIAGINGVNEVGQTIHTQSSVPIPRRQVINVNYEKYKASQVKIVEIGPFNWEEEGDAGITLNNNSYVGTIQTAQIRASEYKTSNITESQIIDRLVASINNGTSYGHQMMLNTFCTATKLGTTPADLKIRVTMKSEHVNFSVALKGMLALAPVVTTQKPIVSLGKGADVVRTEVEYSGNLGNGGYWGFNEGYFNKPLEASASVNYDIFNITWMGEHDTPQNKIRVTRNHLMIAVPTTATALITALIGYFDDFFGAAFDKTDGALVPSGDDPDETNNDPELPSTGG